MALFGKQSQADQKRAHAVKAWAQARSPYALFSSLFGAMAIIDSITGVLGVLFGLTAVVLGVRGLSDLKRRRHLLGHRLCYVGLTLGAAGMAIGGVLWSIVYPMLSSGRS